MTFVQCWDQRRRRWVDVVQMLYKCFVFAEKQPFPGQNYDKRKNTFGGKQRSFISVLGYIPEAIYIPRIRTLSC